MHAQHIRGGNGSAVGFGPGGDRYITKLDSAATGGAFNLTEMIILPASGPPLHCHAHEDELFIILEGELSFWVDGRAIVAAGGDVVFGPRGVPHTFKNCSTRPVRALVQITPPASEMFFKRFTAPAPGGGPASDTEIIARIQRLAPEYGIEILGPSPLG